MADKRKKNALTKKEQATTTAYKLQQQQIDSLKESLKNTQNELETLREEKFKVEKANAILEHKQKSLFRIELFKLCSSACIGIAGSYLISGNVRLTISVAIPSIIVYIICLCIGNK